VIKSFADKTTLLIAERRWVRGVSREIQAAALARLELLEAIRAVEDLRLPPSDRLEKLGGDRAGQWSIRVNRQWRLCFDWRDGHAWNVELVDYH
jgi:proteic killer suppression protein